MAPSDHSIARLFSCCDSTYNLSLSHFNFLSTKKFSLFLIRQVEEREEIKFKKLKEKKSEEYEHLRHYQKTTTILLKRKRDGNVY